MKGIFVESHLFGKLRQKYLSDLEYQSLEVDLLLNPKAGNVIKGTGGLRKIRFSAKGKGKRSGVRVIYYYYESITRFYLLTIDNCSMR